MAADLKGCTEIVSVDLKPNRLAKAEELGATATVDPEDVDDVVEAARELTDGGPNYPLETTGVPEVAEQAVASLTRRGTLGVIGAPALGTEASYDVTDLILNGRTITGVVVAVPTPSSSPPTSWNSTARGSSRSTNWSPTTTSTGSSERSRTPRAARRSSRCCG